MLKTSLSSLCETRWVERHEAVMKIKANFGDIIEALTSISNWIDNKTSSSASTLLNTICTSEFIVSILSLIDVLKITLPLSRLLQTPSLDAIEAAKAVENTVSTLEKKRSVAESEFDSIFKEAQRLAEDTDVSLQLPRLAQKQTKRANYPGSVLDYFRRSVYVPLLDYVINDLKLRLDENSLECFGLRGIIPAYLIDLNEEKEENLIKNLKKGFKKFSSIIGCEDETTNMYLLEGEIDLWRNMWNEENKKGVKLSEEGKRERENKGVGVSLDRPSSFHGPAVRCDRGFRLSIVQELRVEKEREAVSSAQSPFKKPRSPSAVLSLNTVPHFLKSTPRRAIWPGNPPVIKLAIEQDLGKLSKRST